MTLTMHIVQRFVCLEKHSINPIHYIIIIVLGNNESVWVWVSVGEWLFSPVDASVVVVAIEELDLLKGLLAGVVTGQVWVHAKKQVECRRTWEGRRSDADRAEEEEEEESNGQSWSKLDQGVMYWKHKCAISQRRNINLMHHKSDGRNTRLSFKPHKHVRNSACRGRLSTASHPSSEAQWWAVWGSDRTFSLWTKCPCAFCPRTDPVHTQRR